MSAEVAAEAIKAWREDPVRMVRDLFHVEPDEWQRDALRAFADPDKRRISLQACAGPGKSAVLCWMGWNFLLCYWTPEEHPNGFVMSVTGDNLKSNLWKEFAVWFGRSELLRAQFDMTSERIFSRKHPKTWWLEAKAFPKTADPEQQGRTLSGLHAKFILYLIDESGDISPAVLRSAEQGLSNCWWGKIAQAGNPTSHKGILYHAAKEQPHLWHIIQITGDPDDPKRSPRVVLEWAKGQIANYGRDNAWVMAFILGKFPPSSINALLGPDDVRASMERHLNDEQFTYSQKRIGIDVARFGDDATILAPRQGLWAAKMVEMRGADGLAVAGRIAVAKQKWKSELELIDDTGGWASSVIDQCGLGGIHLYRVNFSAKANDPRYFNLRSEMNFKAAEWVKGGGALSPDPQLAREAVAVTYYFEQGKLRVTEKDQIKKELQGHSPDRWDAFCCTFAIPDMPTTEGDEGVLAAVYAQLTGAGKMSSDWDPLPE